MGLFEESTSYMSHEERELALIKYLTNPKTCSCHIGGECGVTIGDLIRQEFGSVYADKRWAVPRMDARQAWDGVKYSLGRLAHELPDGPRVETFRQELNEAFVRYREAIERLMAAVEEMGREPVAH
jgi:hypothetical protein